MKSNDFALVLPNEIHSISVNETGQYFIIVFSSDFVPKFRAITKDKQAQNTVFHCENTVKEMFCRYIMTDSGDLLMKKAVLYAVCSEFLKENTLFPANSMGKAVAGRVLDYIEANYKSDISLKQCAEQLGYEYHYLSRLLNKSYGINFRRTLNRHRLSAATELIAMHELTMSQIAVECGFQSVRSFNDIFKKQYSMTPHEYSERL